MIREATVEDIPACLGMGKAFADEAGVTDRVGWDDGAAKRLLRMLIEAPYGILLMGDNGMIGGMVFPHPYAGTMVFQELFWRSHGVEGVKLLKEAEKRAQALGATLSIMIGMDSLPDLGRLYARQGYEPMERLYGKGL